MDEFQELSSFGFIDEACLSFLPHAEIYFIISEPAWNHSFIHN